MEQNMFGGDLDSSPCSIPDSLGDPGQTDLRVNLYHFCAASDKAAENHISRTCACSTFAQPGKEAAKLP